MASDSVGWPALEWEVTGWETPLPLDAMPRTARRRHTGPYSSAVTPQISERVPALSTKVQALVDQATAEVSRFDSEVGAIVAPFASVLLRTESASSSQIESLTAGTRAIALAEIGATGKANATINVANVRAMRAALELAGTLDLNSILKMHRALLEELDPTGAGRLRDNQVWIGGSDFGPHGAEFVPPRAALVPAAIADLVEFMERDDLPVLTQAAIAHAQFETIHPFFDGNGRTGRALIHAILKAKGLVREVTVPISAGLLTNTNAYFDALGRYREGHPEAIVERFAQASFVALANGRKLVEDLRAIRAGWNEAVEARRDAIAWRLADLVLRQPVVHAQIVQDELEATSANAQRGLRQLASAGVLTS